MKARFRIIVEFCGVLQLKAFATVVRIGLSHKQWLLSLRTYWIDRPEVPESHDVCAFHYRPHSLAKQGDNALGSVCPSVCQKVMIEKQLYLRVH